MAPTPGSVVVTRLRGGCRNKNPFESREWIKVRWPLPAFVAFPVVRWRSHRHLTGANTSDSGNPLVKAPHQRPTGAPPTSHHRPAIATPSPPRLEVAVSCSFPPEKRTKLPLRAARTTLRAARAASRAARTTSRATRDAARPRRRASPRWLRFTHPCDSTLKRGKSGIVRFGPWLKCAEA